jgi:hypothetical protein
VAARSVEVNALGAHIHWEVLWVVRTPDGHRIVQHDCQNDLGAALKIYNRVLGKRRMVTLRSCNVGFPPPEQYQPGYILKRNMERKKKSEPKFIEKYVQPMKGINRKGILWCPYCREMRKFQKQGGFFVIGVFVPDEKGLYCPICGTSHRDYHVRKWNPVAERLYIQSTRTRRTNGSSRSTPGRRPRSKRRRS